MPIDRSKISEGPMAEDGVRRYSEGGWGLFVKMAGGEGLFTKMEGEWKSYSLDGENGIIKDEAVAREMYDLALADPRCESARLVQIKGVAAFNRGT